MARILVVEDVDDIRSLVMRRLVRAGHRVHGAAGGLEALGLMAERGAPDVVVLDVNMPGINGLDLLHMMREQTGLSGLPAVFLSGLMQPEDIAAGRSLGAVYLTKPFVSSALLGAIETLLTAKATATAEPLAQEW